MRLARFARVRLLRHALPISLLILRKKPTVLQSTTIQALQAKAEEAMGKDSSQREKSEYEMKVTLRMNTLMKDRVEMITAQVMPMKMMFPHPSAFQRDMFYSIIRRQNRTRLAEKIQKNILSISLNHNC